MELHAQAAQYQSAHDKLASETAGLEEVAKSLRSRSESVSKEVKPLFDAEVAELGNSLENSKSNGAKTVAPSSGH